MDKDTELFKGKTFADIMSDVYHNSKKKDRQLKLLIAQLEPLVKNLQDATVIVPLIKEYMEVAVRNDEQIVKLAAIIQRMMKDENSGEGGGLGLSDEEKKQLLENAKAIDNKIDALSNTEGDE
jgi:tripartite-type tricarboxylate transporter receptor subunit TctC|tara:strand:- start:1445 stop:1813 length:369 start_codon:yes stop_codon:yes gene_type:complete